MMSKNERYNVAMKQIRSDFFYKPKPSKKLWYSHRYHRWVMTKNHTTFDELLKKYPAAQVNEIQQKRLRSLGTQFRDTPWFSDCLDGICKLVSKLWR